MLPPDDGWAAVNELRKEKSAAKEARKADLALKRRQLYAWNDALKQRFLTEQKGHDGELLDGV